MIKVKYETQQVEIKELICDICDMSADGRSCHICDRDICMTHSYHNYDEGSDYYHKYCIECWNIGKKYKIKLQKIEDKYDKEINKLNEDWKKEALDNIKIIM